jgi:hypothetical protein
LLGTLELLGPKYRYVVTGYPPFLKGLVDTAKLDFSEFDICAVVGGEGMSEPLRASLNRCFRKTISSFGASDLEINLAVETDFTIALRQAIAGNAALGRDLYGDREGLPMIFQYDPLNTWIESDADRTLLFTLNRLENVMAAAEESRGDAFESLLLSAGDRLVSGVMSNVFLLTAGALRTPAVDRVGVAGVMRQVVLREAPRLGIAAREQELGLSDLFAADAIFITNARIGVVPVRRVGEHVFAMSELVKRLRTTIEALDA